MLETKELVKIYKPKKGVPVTALDKITLQFPDKGMVFLLGKSGSGKSTLLNVLGGLDRYDSGEILIKGVSSKSFKQQHFDSYRNTYVGFIFQEYNVLDEFTVGANIALAIELQNRKASDSEINDILKQVDLEGFGDRKPNELSGGQKQRVAIARALVKKPEIIMADEPTGALDSNTGRQVFDTLKKLSETKLVIVVSHDREFAEQYADRIIELSDGRVISDVELDALSAEQEETEALDFHENVVSVPCGYHLTEDDRKAINSYIEKLAAGSLEITVSRKNQSAKRFVKTDISKIQKQNGASFQLIKSKLPLKNAFKIGASGLKHKKIRLVITILLSCIAFGLFGLSDTFGAYNHIKTCTNSLMDSGSKYVSVGKAKKIGKDVNAYWRDYGYRLSDKEIAALSQKTDVKLHGVYAPTGANLSFDSQINPNIKLTETDYPVYNTSFYGFAEINERLLDEMGMKLLAGSLPDGTKNEIAVSEYIFEVFKKANYYDGTTVKKNAKGENEPVYTTVGKAGDLIGKSITLNGQKYTVSAVIDTGFDFARYQDLAVQKKNQSKADKLVEFVLSNEFSFSLSYSYAGVVMVGEGALSPMIAARPPMTEITEGFINFYGDKISADSNYLARLSDVPNEKIIWLNGAKTQLGEKELVITLDTVYDTTEGEFEQAEDKGAFLKQNSALTSWEYDFDENQNVEGYQIVGYIDNTSEGNSSRLRSTIVCSDSLFNRYTDGTDGVYSYAVGTMPTERNAVQNMVSHCYEENSKLRYPIQNATTYELDSVNDVLKTLSKYFFWIGIGFAAFAALMLANFIGTSISYKKQEIGILRAIGSRSNDVFRIFFAESFIIAMINFVLSGLGVLAATMWINYMVRNELGVLVTVLSFGLRQIALLLAVSVLVAFVASFLPVKKIASKRPIDAIRNR